MKIRAAIITFIFSIIGTASYSQYQFDQIIVDQEWLKTNLDSDELILFHVGKEEDYNVEHIPGALLISPENFAVARGNLYWEIPDEKDFRQTLNDYGVTESSTIVLYYGNEIFAATYRLYMTLEYYGVSDQVRILDGGLKGWKYNGLEVTKDIPDTGKGKISLSVNENVIADKDEVLGVLDKDGIIVLDARRPDYYSGAKTGNYIRGGHITSAKNVTWLNLVDENQFLKPQSEIENLFSEAGVEKEDDVITYCHVGLRASMLYTISKALGHETKLYDGSFNEWDGLGEEYPTEGSK